MLNSVLKGVSLIPMFAMLAALLVAWDATAGEPIEDLLEATFRIADNEHSGTCFLVSPKSVDSANPRRVILATAAHVVEQMTGNDCEVFLRSEGEDGLATRRPLTITIRTDGKPLWTRHPDADIAVLSLDLPVEVLSNPIPFAQIADEQSLEKGTVRVGREVWIPCYPAKLEANEAGWPVLRHGTIASHPLLPIKSHRTMLIDYTHFGGDSGAPVAILVNDHPIVVGVVSAMHRQTDRSVLPFEERVVHTPLGLSIVSQGAFLRETIELMGAK
jgi:hypothetical protein